MSYVKQSWTDRQVQYPLRFTQSFDANNEYVTLTPAPGTVAREGTYVTADRMNHIENGISDLDTAFKNNSTFNTTDETKVGTWTDGNPLYMKTFDFGTLPNNSTSTLKHNLTNVGKIWIDQSNSYVLGGDYKSYPTVGDSWLGYVDNNYIYFNTTKDWTSLRATVTLLFTIMTDDYKENLGNQAIQLVKNNTEYGTRTDVYFYANIENSYYVIVEIRDSDTILLDSYGVNMITQTVQKL